LAISKNPGVSYFLGRDSATKPVSSHGCTYVCHDISAREYIPTQQLVITRGWKLLETAAAADLLSFHSKRRRGENYFLYGIPTCNIILVGRHVVQLPKGNKTCRTFFVAAIAITTTGIGTDWCAVAAAWRRNVASLCNCLLDSLPSGK
jgi:hypothetical protein